jgi:hypothetical protein
MVLFASGTVLEHGGSIPGTTHVIPGVAGLSWLGACTKWAAVYLGAGGKLTLAPHPAEKPADP